jgi:hypothetical protein
MTTGQKVMLFFLGQKEGTINMLCFAMKYFDTSTSCR